MNRIFYGLLKILSYLPFKVLYGISTVLYYINHYLIHYRRKTVQLNLNNSFPEKTKEEKHSIEKQYFRNFMDFLIETLKTYSMKREDYQKRIRFVNLDLAKESVQNGKDVILLMGHNFNWEWLTGISPDLPFAHAYAVYRGIRNKYFRNKLIESRSHFGTIPLLMSKTAKTMIGLPNDGTHIFLFIADQCPSKAAIHYELEFLNQTTPVFNGYDKLTRKKKFDVIYLDMIKVARGKYEACMKRILPENGTNFQENELTHKFYQELTQNIYNNPSNWLWSHKRWKYKNGRDYHI